MPGSWACPTAPSILTTPPPVCPDRRPPPRGHSRTSPPAGAGVAAARGENLDSIRRLVDKGTVIHDRRGPDPGPDAGLTRANIDMMGEWMKSAIVRTPFEGPAKAVQRTLGRSPLYRHPELYDIWLEEARIAQVVARVVGESSHCVDVGAIWA